MHESNAKEFSKELYDLIAKHYPSILTPADKLQEDFGIETVDGVFKMFVDVDLRNPLMELRVGYSRGSQEFNNSILITNF